MKLVRESIKFTRGQDPKGVMRIGAAREIPKMKKDLMKKYGHMFWKQYPYGFGFKKWTEKSQGVIRLNFAFKVLASSAADDIHNMMRPYLKDEIGSYEVDTGPVEHDRKVTTITTLKFKIADPFAKMFYDVFYPDREKK